MSKVRFVISGRLTAFHHSEAGGLVICMRPDRLGGISPEDLQTIPATAEASLSVEIEIPEAPISKAPVIELDPAETEGAAIVRREGDPRGSGAAL